MNIFKKNQFYTIQFNLKIYTILFYIILYFSSLYQSISQASETNSSKKNVFLATATGEYGHPNSNGQLSKEIKKFCNSEVYLNVKNLESFGQEIYKKLKLDYNPFFKYVIKNNKEKKKVTQSNSLLFWMICNDHPNTLSILEKFANELETHQDPNGNNVLHIAALFGKDKIIDQIINFKGVIRGKINEFTLFINHRNEDGTNPLGMVFLNPDNNVKMKDNRTKMLKVSELFINGSTFKINKYLNNRRGMDCDADLLLKRIGGYNCLHMACVNNDIKLLEFLEARNQNFKKTPNLVNFLYSSLNPDSHMTSPNLLINRSGNNNIKEFEKKLEALQQAQKDLENADDSGNSDDDEKPAFLYKQVLKDLNQFIKAAENLPNPLSQEQIQKYLDALNNSAKFEGLNAKEKQEVKDFHSKIVIPHFHGVPFMQGQYKNHERRAVAKKLFEINEKKLNALLKSTILLNELNEEDLIMSGLHSRTSTASAGIDNLYDLVNASEDKLKAIHEINQLLEKYLADCWMENNLSSLNVLEDYIFKFSNLKMQDLWEKLKDIIYPPEDIVKYRFPFLSTSKAPDHAVKFGFGKNVETQSLGELPLYPHYTENGYPTHRLAGLMYISLHSIDELEGLYMDKKIADAPQLYKTLQIGNNGAPNRRIMKQIESTFFGGIDSRHIKALIPIIYPNFSKAENMDEYYKHSSYSYRAPYDTTIKEEFFGNELPQCYKTTDQSISKAGKVLMPYNVKMALKMAQASAKLQGKYLCYYSAESKLKFYPLGYDKKTVFSTAQREISGEIPGSGSPATMLKDNEAKELLTKINAGTPSKLFSKAINEIKLQASSEKKELNKIKNPDFSDNDNFSEEDV